MGHLGLCNRWLSTFDPKRSLGDRLTTSSPSAWRKSLKQLTTHLSASSLERGWGASGRWRNEIVPHPERCGGTTLHQNIEHIHDRLAQGWIALEFKRPRVDMPL